MNHIGSSSKSSSANSRNHNHHHHSHNGLDAQRGTISSTTAIIGTATRTAAVTGNKYFFSRMIPPVSSVMYQFRIILIVTIVYIFITVTMQTSFISKYHQNENSHPNIGVHCHPSSNTSSIDWSLYSYNDDNDDGLTLLQMQHILRHVPSSTTTAGNILIWYGTQYTAEDKNLFQRMVLFWNSVALSRGGIVVMLVESNDETDQDYFSSRASTTRTKITTTQAYYNAIHRQYPQMYVYTIKYTTKSNNVMKQFRFYHRSNQQVWDNQLNIATIIPNIVYTTPFDVILIDRPGMGRTHIFPTNDNIDQSGRTLLQQGDPIAGPFQAIYMTQQIIQNSFQQILTTGDTSDSINNNRNNQEKYLLHPIHVFFVMDADLEIATPTVAAATMSIEQKFSNKIFDCTPIRIVPSILPSATMIKYNATATTADVEPNSIHSYHYDLAQYIFYDNDPYMIVPKEISDE